MNSQQSSSDIASRINLPRRRRRKQRTRYERKRNKSPANQPGRRSFFNGAAPAQLIDVQQLPEIQVAPMGLMFNGFFLGNAVAPNTPTGTVPSSHPHPPFQTTQPEPPKQIWMNNVLQSLPPQAPTSPPKWSFYTKNPPPPTSVEVNNMAVNVPPAAPKPGEWPFYTEQSPPPRFVWMGDRWEPVIHTGDRWQIDSASQLPQWPLPLNVKPNPIFVLVNNIWILASTPNMLWNPTTSSFRPPEQLFPPQSESPTRYIWLNDKWEQVTFINNKWIVVPPGQPPSSPGSYQRPPDSVYALVDDVWVLVPSNYIPSASVNTRPSPAFHTPPPPASYPQPPSPPASYPQPPPPPASYPQPPPPPASHPQPPPPPASYPQPPPPPASYPQPPPPPASYPRPPPQVSNDTNIVNVTNIYVVPQNSQIPPQSPQVSNHQTIVNRTNIHILPPNNQSPGKGFSLTPVTPKQNPTPVPKPKPKPPPHVCVPDRSSKKTRR